MILLLRELPTVRVQLPTTKRGTIIVWQTASGRLAVHPPDAKLVEASNWWLKPNHQGNAMICRGGSCGLNMIFD